MALIYKSANLIPSIDNEEFFFIKELRSIQKNGEKNTLFSHLFGGKLEGSETAKTCAIREFMEEFFGSEKVSNSFKREIERVLFGLEMKETYFVVNERLNYVNVFFTFDINQINDDVIKDFFYNLDQKFQEAEFIKQVFKWRKGQELENPSTLLLRYVEELNSTEIEITDITKM